LPIFARRRNIISSQLNLKGNFPLPARFFLRTHQEHSKLPVASHKHMKLILLTIFALLLFAPVFSSAQTLPSTYKFEREVSEDGGVLYSLTPVAAEIIRKKGLETPYQIVGAVARLDTQKAVIIFANAQRKFQLATQSDKSVTIFADSATIDDLEYQMAAQSDGDTVIKLEIGNTVMTFAQFEKIMNADSVTVAYGAVSYKLDKENIQALHYFAAQIEKDRKKNKSGSGGAPGR
jgi:hypothetical protein